MSALPWTYPVLDSPEELLAQISLGEDSALELKAVTFRGDKIDGPKRAELADEIAAMANTLDGVLVLGVDDCTRSILGIPMDKLDALERYVFEICNDSIEPPVVFRAFRLTLPDEAGVARPVLKLEIARSLFVHKSPGGYFHRQGSSKREMSPALLARLFQQRSQARILRFDEQAVPETSFSSLDAELFERFVQLDDADPRERLSKRGLMTTDEQGAERCTVAGVLMCSRTPQTWLPSALIQAVRYRGIEQDSNHQIDAQEITGSLDQQVFEAMSFVRRNMSVLATKTPARVEVPQFSLRAVFEALVNAVAHRDYSVYASKVRLFMFDDRLMLFSPGPLPNTLNVDTMALRQATRNELLTTLLAKCPVRGDGGDIGRAFLMEKRGDGVPIILRESERLSGRKPEYRMIDDAELLLTIWAARG